MEIRYQTKKITGFTKNEESTVWLAKVVPISLENRMRELDDKFAEG
jgi:hypothetical protein